MENNFGQPQSVVVFGGSSDIARALTKRLCAARANTVVLCGRNQALLDEAVEEAKDYGASTTETVLFDAEKVSNAAKVVTEAFKKVGGNVDLVVVAVGLLGDQFAQENDAKASARVALVNFAWPVAALAEIRRRLVDQGHGRILVMSSVAAIRVRRRAYLYGGAKAGLDRLCDGLADSLEGTGVRLQLLRPGVVRTRMTEGQAPIPFTTGPEEVAGYVMKGLATNDRIIWSPPIMRYAFAMLRHLPKPIWRIVSDR
ncbi:MAG: SDR family NAD(P)-dependent oxidoreductase [Acidimicrobiales bacterium]